MENIELVLDRFPKILIICFSNWILISAYILLIPAEYTVYNISKNN